MANYRLAGRLGAGGMGVVYLAADPTGRKVALKTMRSDVAHEPGFRERFWREVEVMRAVTGPHTAAVVDAGSHAGLPFLVTEYVDGPSWPSTSPRPGPWRKTN
ncbi:protein kinase [Streptacidiphilus monticola]